MQYFKCFFVFGLYILASERGGSGIRGGIMLAAVGSTAAASFVAVEAVNAAVRAAVPTQEC